MKKLLVILVIFLIPMITNAKEVCTVTKGNGTTVGDEIQCGTESFYVFSTTQNKISLLSKYNLLVGDKIDYLPIDDEVQINDFEDAVDYCETALEDAGYKPYYTYPIPNENGFLEGCRSYEVIEYEHVRQDEKAVGTKLDGSGMPILPSYGITYMNPEWGYEAFVKSIIYIHEYDSKGDLIVRDSAFNKYLNGYKAELESQGLEIDSVTFPTLTKTLNLLENISGEEVVLGEFEPRPEGGYPEAPGTYLGKINIKDHIGNNHKWISSSTYWLGSGFMWYMEELPGSYTEYNDFYISNEGMLCALGRGDCSYFEYPIGNGVRPLVTISKSTLGYKITTKTDGNGTIEVVNKAAGNETIQFKVTSKKGYEINKIKITSVAGATIKFTEGDIINNKDGTVSIDKNKFTMPFADVTIEAEWTIENPDTGESIIVAIILLVVMGGITFYFKKKSIDKQINVETV